jgi:hypothetical protein
MYMQTKHLQRSVSDRYANKGLSTTRTVSSLSTGRGVLRPRDTYTVSSLLTERGVLRPRDT